MKCLFLSSCIPVIKQNVKILIPGGRNGLMTFGMSYQTAALLTGRPSRRYKNLKIMRKGTEFPKLYGGTAGTKLGLIGKGIKDGEKAIKVNKNRCSVACIAFNNTISPMDTVFQVHGFSTSERQNGMDR